MSLDITSTASLCSACPLRDSEENLRLPEHVRSVVIRRTRLCRNASVAKAEGGHRLSIVRTGEIKAERLARRATPR